MFRYHIIGWFYRSYPIVKYLQLSKSEPASMNKALVLWVRLEINDELCFSSIARATDISCASAIHWVIYADNTEESKSQPFNNCFLSILSAINYFKLSEKMNGFWKTNQYLNAQKWTCQLHDVNKNIFVYFQFLILHLWLKLKQHVSLTTRPCSQAYSKLRTNYYSLHWNNHMLYFTKSIDK